MELIANWKTSNNKKQFLREIVFDVSQNISRDVTSEIPAIVSKNEERDTLSRQELLEVSKNINLYYAPKILSNTQKLVLLPIDPEHCHVYWSLEGAFSHRREGQDLHLRVFSHTKEDRKSGQAKLLYETTIHISQARQKIKLRLSEKGVVYTASIGQYLSDNGFIALINSNNIYTFYETNVQKKKGDDLALRPKISQVSSIILDNKSVINFNDKSVSNNHVKSVKSQYASINTSGQNTNK